MMPTTAELTAQVARLQRQLDHVTRPPAFDEAEKVSAAYHRADPLLQRLGTPTPPPAPGESAERYRQRLVAKLQPHTSLSQTPLPIGTLTGGALATIEDKIYADAQAAARNPQNIRPGELRAVKERDQSGRLITTYVGDPMAWRNAFTAAGIGVVMPKS